MYRTLKTFVVSSFFLALLVLPFSFNKVSAAHGGGMGGDVHIGAGNDRWSGNRDWRSDRWNDRNFDSRWERDNYGYGLYGGYGVYGVDPYYSNYNYYNPTPRADTPYNDLYYMNSPY